MARKRYSNGTIQQQQAPRPAFERLLQPMASQSSLSVFPQYSQSSATQSAIPQHQQLPQTSSSIEPRQASVAPSDRRDLRAVPVASTSKQQTPAPTTKPKKASTSLNPKDYWNNPGMRTLINWMTEPGNYERLNNKNAVSGQKPKDIKRQLLQHINEQEGTDWSAEQLKTKLQYMTRRYDQAKKIKNKTGKGDTTTESLQKRISDICPVFDRLAEVFEADLDRNPFIGWDSVSAVDIFDHDQEEEIDDLTSDEDENDVDEDDENGDNGDDDIGSQDNISTDAGKMKGKGKGPASKRRKIDTDLQNMKRMESVVASLAKQRQQALNLYESDRNDLTNREAALLAKDQEFTKIPIDKEIAHDAIMRQRYSDQERMLARRAEEHERRVEEHERRVEEHERRVEEHTRRAIELKEEKEEFKAQKDELKRLQDELKREQETLVKRWGTFFRATVNARDDPLRREEAMLAGLDGSLIPLIQGGNRTS
ncbi:hypothetical protein BGX21_010070 [Mortierella sp. AD011]|nr:hypothetical protein BGX20_001952 [Mortierella sp. AD010]KAF9395133.1 hypothetical protein BGX21_010070 [Mortierella sp. AD011]